MFYRKLGKQYGAFYLFAIKEYIYILKFLLSRKLIKPVLWKRFCNLKMNRKRNMLNWKCLYLIENWLFY